MNGSWFRLTWFLRPRLILLVVIGFAMLAYTVSNVLQVAGVGTLYVSPANQTVTVGDTFDTSINIDGVADLQGALVTINYDSAKMSFQGFAVGPALSGSEFPPFVSASACGASTCQFIVVRAGTTFSGSGTLFTITWLALAPGTFIDIDESATELSDGDDDEIAFSTADGTVTIIPAAANQPDLVLTKTDSPTFVPTGGALTYTLTSSNVGSATAGGYFIDDFIPSGVRVTAEVTSEGDCDQISPFADETPSWVGPATIRCGPFTTLASGSDTVTLTVTVTAGAGTIVNSATTDSGNDVAESNEANNSDSEITTVTAGPDLVLTKSSSADTVISGGSLIFTLLSSNIGAGTATEYIIDDLIPAGITVTAFAATDGAVCAVGADPTPPWQGPATIRCGPFTAAAGFSDTVTLTATITVLPGNTVLNGALTDSDDTVSETNEDADDPEFACTSVGEGVDVAPATEADNYDCLAITVVGNTIWGDVNCNGNVDAVDALMIFRWIAALTVFQTAPCSDINSNVGIID